MKLEIKRIDHFGIVAGIIKDLEIVKTIDDLLGRQKEEEISHGEAIAGMILNGLHFISKPLMLTPKFFENIPLEQLIRDGITPEHFNRHKLGRVLDNVAGYGTEKLFGQIALKACSIEKINMKFAHADTTSYSLTGEYDSDSDTEKLLITHGHSKDMRPDLKQVMQELITSQDGGIPFATKAWSGNASDSVILRERAIKLMDEFKKSDSRCFVADSKLFCEKTAETLDKINFITRVPSSINLEKATIKLALEKDGSWMVISDEYKMQEFPTELYNISDQRWIVIFSKHAKERSEKTLKKEIEKESQNLKKALHKLQAQRFFCETDAKKELKSIAKKFKYHQVSEGKIVALKYFSKRGRPSENAEAEYEWQIIGQSTFNQTYFEQTLNQRSCFVLATNIASEKLSTQEVLTAYKGQDKTEKGFAFLKSPEFFTSSLFLKKPSRIDGLLMIMVLSLLVYSIAQRRIRNQLKALGEKIPDQINKPTANPTARWIFQLFEGINYVSIYIKKTVEHSINGLNEIREKIIRLLGDNVKKIYQVN